MWGAFSNIVNNSDGILGSISERATKLLENLDREYESEGEDAKVEDSDAEAISMVTAEVPRVNEKQAPVLKDDKFDEWDDFGDNLEALEVTESQPIEEVTVPNVVKKVDAKPSRLKSKISSPVTIDLLNHQQQLDAITNDLTFWKSKYASEVNDLKSKNSDLAIKLRRVQLENDAISSKVVSLQQSLDESQLQLLEFKETNQQFMQSKSLFKILKGYLETSIDVVSIDGVHQLLKDDLKDDFSMDIKSFGLLMVTRLVDNQTNNQLIRTLQEEVLSGKELLQQETAKRKQSERSQQVSSLQLKLEEVKDMRVIICSSTDSFFCHCLFAFN